MRVLITVFSVITGTLTLLGCGGHEAAGPTSPSADTSPALPFPHNFDLLTKQQAREWAIGSWTLDYEAKLKHAPSAEELAALERERQDRIAALEFRDDGTFTMSDKLPGDTTGTTKVGKWDVQHARSLAAKSDDGETLHFSLQPNGFLLQTASTEKGSKEDYWKKIR